MMRILIPYFNDKIANVFDFSEHFLLVDSNNSNNIHRKTILLKEVSPLIKSQKIIDLKVDLIICGAISKKAVFLLREENINILPFVEGNIDEVLNAFFNEKINNKNFLLPGCPKIRPKWAFIYKKNKKRYRNNHK